MEYKRLKEKLETILTLPELPFEEDLTAVDCKQMYDILCKIEQGTLIELPCKVGDKFYGICGFVIFEYTTLAIKLVKDHKICLCTIYDMEYVLGKDAFLTLEDAEKRFKELQNG